MNFWRFYDFAELFVIVVATFIVVVIVFGIFSKKNKEEHKHEQIKMRLETIQKICEQPQYKQECADFIKKEINKK